MKTSRRRFLDQAARFGLVGGLSASTLYSYAGVKTRSSRRKRPFGANDTVRLGVIGTGGRGTNLIENLSQMDGMDVVACCDILPFRLDKALSLSHKGAKGYSDYRKLLEDPSIDAVILATPLYLHFDMAKDVIDAGKHLYCEKTMTFTVEETKALGPLVDGSDKVFQVGYQHRYNPLYKKVQQIIQGDEFGSLSHVECYWNRNGDWRRPVPSPELERIINWRMYREYSGGMMAELSSHQINIVNFIKDDAPVRVFGSGGIDFWKDGRETFDNVHATFIYGDGTKLDCTCLTTNAHLGFQLNFYGKNASIQISREDNKYLARLYVEPAYLQSFEEKKEQVDAVTSATEMWSKGEAIPIYSNEAGKEDEEPTADALAAFGDCIRENKKALVGYESGRDSAICVALANKAMQTESVVHWKDYI